MQKGCIRELGIDPRSLKSQSWAITHSNSSLKDSEFELSLDNQTFGGAHHYHQHPWDMYFTTEPLLTNITLPTRLLPDLFTIDISAV